MPFQVPSFRRYNTPLSFLPSFLPPFLPSFPPFWIILFDAKSFFDASFLLCKCIFRWWLSMGSKDFKWMSAMSHVWICIIPNVEALLMGIHLGRRQIPLRAASSSRPILRLSNLRPTFQGAEWLKGMGTCFQGICQHTPGTYPRPRTNSLWRNSFHLGIWGGVGYAPGVCWGSLRMFEVTGGISICSCRWFWTPTHTNWPPAELRHQLSNNRNQRREQSLFFFRSSTNMSTSNANKLKQKSNTDNPGLQIRT